MNEGALVFASIIMGVAVTDLLSSFHRLLGARERVRWDWLTLVVTALVLLTLVQIWWRLAGSGSAPLTLGAFLPTLAVLIVLFLLAAAVLPDEIGEGRFDLRDHYRRQHRVIWSMFATALAILLLTEGMAKVGSGIPWHRAIMDKLGDLLVLGLMISLAVVRARKWHAGVLLALLLTGPLGWLALVLR